MKVIRDVLLYTGTIVIVLLLLAIAGIVEFA